MHASNRVVLVEADVATKGPLMQKWAQGLRQWSLWLVGEGSTPDRSAGLMLGATVAVVALLGAGAAFALKSPSPSKATGARSADAAVYKAALAQKKAARHQTTATTQPKKKKKTSKTVITRRERAAEYEKALSLAMSEKSHHRAKRTGTKVRVKHTHHHVNTGAYKQSTEASAAPSSPPVDALSATAAPDIAVHPPRPGLPRTVTVRSGGSHHHRHGVRLRRNPGHMVGADRGRVFPRLRVQPLHGRQPGRPVHDAGQRVATDLRPELRGQPRHRGHDVLLHGTGHQRRRDLGSFQPGVHHPAGQLPSGRYVGGPGGGDGLESDGEPDTGWPTPPVRSTHGSVPYYGSMANVQLNAPIIQIVSTADGRGYWEVASDGGVFAYGDAGYYGSMGGHPLNAPIVGFATTTNGRGYWEVASDGGVFAFGDARFGGSMAGHSLDQPIVGIALDRGTGGYWEVASNGDVFAFGGAPNLGSPSPSAVNEPSSALPALPRVTATGR